MGYQPQFTITPGLLARVEPIAAVRERIQAATVEVPWIAVGYRVHSPRGVQFRRWASTALKEFLLKGFVMDNERLKNPDGRPDYFGEMLERIRDIRASETHFYQKVRDLVALSHHDPPQIHRHHRGPTANLGFETKLGVPLGVRLHT